MLEDCCDRREPGYSGSWRTDWPQRCRDWAEYFDGPWGDGSERGDKVSEREKERILEEHARLAREFGGSPYAAELSDLTPEEAAGEIENWLTLAHQYTSLAAGRMSLAVLRKALYIWMPARLIDPPEYFEQLPFLLAAFLRFLHASGRLDQPEPFFALAEEARTRLPELAADPTNWSWGKSFLMRGQRAGFDVSTEEGRAAWIQAFLEIQSAELRNGKDEAGDQEEYVTAPIHRDEPRVGRNDPCPCGSGRKYKKCHGLAA